MLKGENIICFGSSTWDYPGLQQRVMRELSVDNKIIFINSIGTRKLSLKIDQLPFYIKRVMRSFSKTRSVNQNVIVCDPFILPFANMSVFNEINRILLSFQINRVMSNCNFSEYILWVGTPTAEPFMDLFSPKLKVYNPVDRYFAFDFVDKEKIIESERKIASRSDLVLGTSDAIKDDLSPYNDNTFSISHGVDFRHFEKAALCEEVPPDIRDIQKPIIGFFGGLSERLNYDLILKTALKYPRYSVVLVGARLTDLSGIAHVENIHILGHKSFSDLPFYLKEFDVCIIPYKVNELTVGVDPIKLREYLSIGKPVVSVDLPEVRKMQHVVYVGDSEGDFISCIEQAITGNCKEKERERVRIASMSDWKVKIEEISKIIGSYLGTPV